MTDRSPFDPASLPPQEDTTDSSPTESGRPKRRRARDPADEGVGAEHTIERPAFYSKERIQENINHILATKELWLTPAYALAIQAQLLLEGKPLDAPVRHRAHVEWTKELRFLLLLDRRPVKEIAESLGVSSGSIYAQKKESREMVQRLFEEGEFDRVDGRYRCTVCLREARDHRKALLNLNIDHTFKILCEGRLVKT
jgi:hypothetical protein